MVFSILWIMIAKENRTLTGRIGFTYAPKYPDQIPGALAELNLFFGSGNHHLEIGAGCTYLYLFSGEESSPDFTLFILNARIGYRSFRWNQFRVYTEK